MMRVQQCNTKHCLCRRLFHFSSAGRTTAMPDEPGPGPGARALEALEALGDAELRARVEALRETIRCGPPRPRRPPGGGG